MYTVKKNGERLSNILNEVCGNTNNKEKVVKDNKLKAWEILKTNRILKIDCGESVTEEVTAKPLSAKNYYASGYVYDSAKQVKQTKAQPTTQAPVEQPAAGGAGGTGCNGVDGGSGGPGSNSIFLTFFKYFDYLFS